MTRDLRRRALESHRTVSKKTQSRLASQEASPASSKPSSRTASRTVSRHGSDEEDGNLSDGTNWSLDSINDFIGADLPDAEGGEIWRANLADRIEEIINVKRSSGQGRQLALARFIRSTMVHYAYEEVVPRINELVPALVKSVRAGSTEQESCLALRALAMTIVTAPSEDIYDGLFQPLKRSLQDAESSKVKVAAIHTLSVALEYAGAADSEIEAFMDELLEIVESDGASVEATDDPDVVAAACEAWGFLATSIEDVQERSEDAVAAFAEQLDSTYASVQVAAGENIALLYEKSYTDREEDDEPVNEDDEDEEGFPVDTSLVKRYDAYRQTGQLKGQLSRLANISSRQVSKKDRKSLHTNFSDILNTVEHPWRGPRYQKAIDSETGRRYGSRMVVKIQKLGSMTIDKWWKLHRLQALRRALGSGFVTHYEHNPVVFESLPILTTKN